MVKMRQNARKFGPILGALTMALLLLGTVALAPCLVSAEDGEGGRLIQDSSGIGIEGSGAGEPVAPAFGSPDGGDILFEQPPFTPSEPWGAFASDAGAGVLCFDDFRGLTSDIGDIHWYGLSVDSYLELCNVTGMGFEIIFY
jgi:hypothetical protein